MDIIDSINEILYSRPFFSIIIPCYNSKTERIIELLQSILNAGCINETEIIIADDRSTDKSYLNEIENFIAQTHIEVKIITVPEKNEDGIELIHCPGNTREYGVRAATGQWITFIDHDDVLLENALIKVKNAIEENNEKYLVYGNFIQTNPIENKVIREMYHAGNWMHGKFYNLDNFWKANDFHFEINMFSQEDIAITSRTICIWSRINKDKYDKEKGAPNLWIEDYIYNWRSWPDSTSNTKYDDLSYNEKFFKNYMRATMDVYINDYNSLKENNLITDFDIEFHKFIQADSLIHLYFYTQCFKFRRIPNYIDYEFLAKKYLREFYVRFDTNADDLFEFIDNHYKNKRGKLYFDIRNDSIESVGNFVEVDSFYDFLYR